MKTFTSFLIVAKASSVFQRMIQLVVLLGGVYMFPGCASGLLGQPEYVTWKEEVKLNDGRVIVVTQKRHCFAAYTGGNVANCIERESWLTVKLPEFGNQAIVWHENLKPKILNVHDKKLYVVGTPATGREFDLYDKPRPPYIGFLWVGGQWERIPFADIPAAIYDINLVIDGALVKTNFLSFSEKNSSAFNGNSGYPEQARRIDPNYKSNF